MNDDPPVNYTPTSIQRSNPELSSSDVSPLFSLRSDPQRTQDVGLHNSVHQLQLNCDSPVNFTVTSIDGHPNSKFDGFKLGGDGCTRFESGCELDKEGQRV